MKVILLNGSPHPQGNTYQALKIVADQLNQHGITTEFFSAGNRPTQDCIACGGCVGKGHCVFNDDIVNPLIDTLKTADGVIFGSPVYYAHPSGRLLSLLDRLFYAGGQVLAHKPAAVIATARRAGTTATLDVLNKYLTFAQMPVVASTYWNMQFGASDAEGVQTMQNLANNMAWLLQCIQAGKTGGINPPANQKSIRTNFIR